MQTQEKDQTTQIVRALYFYKKIDADQFKQKVSGLQYNNSKGKHADGFFNQMSFSLDIFQIKNKTQVIPLKKISYMIFNNGSCKITGCKSINEIIKSSRLIFENLAVNFSKTKQMYMP